MTVLVSACLVGTNCKYDGENNLCPEILTYLEGKSWIPICPEQLGGLSTPRKPVEIHIGDGEQVLRGQARVMAKDGEDVTDQFIRGANEVLKLGKLVGAEEAILKAKSPSCGVGQIYDGTFSGLLNPGSGVTAVLLKQHGVNIYTEQDLKNR